MKSLVDHLADELIHRLKSFPAPRAARNYNTSSALGYGWWFVNKAIKIVLANLLLEQANDVLPKIIQNLSGSRKVIESGPQWKISTH